MMWRGPSTGADELARAPEWIVCGREERRVMGSQVLCPLRDVVGVERCLTCHLLEAVENDRDGDCGELSG
jgi:hypothetical protein